MTEIRPYIGYGEINFNMTLTDVKTLLKQKRQHFRHDHRPNKGDDPEVAWDIIRIDNSINIYFAKSKMWKIEFENSFIGRLKNGISLGTPIKEALRIDPTLEYNEWDEQFESQLGYWLVDNIETGAIVAIAIFIKEVENDELFYSYNWCE
ncbi:MAG: hypothetical protein Q4F00_10585 [bacterium]|nr:hypothetical protein [bacterium]